MASWTGRRECLGPLVLVYSFIAATVLLKTSAAEISWSSESHHVTQGDDLQLSCVISQFPMFDVAKTILIKENGVELAISDNNDLKPMFSNTQRYSLNVKYEGDKAIVNLSYRGVRGEDAGRLVCYTASDPSVKAETQLNVEVPVQSVTLLVVEGETEKNVASGDSVQLTEGKESGIVCVIILDGTEQKPDVLITVGGKDVTKQFTRSEVALPKTSDDQLPKVGSEIRYTYKTFEPNREFNRQEMAFKVEGRTAKNDLHKVKVYVDVYYIPDVSCRTVEYFAPENTTASITCSIYSNPAPDWSFTFQGEDGRSIDIREHPHHEQFRVESKQVSDDHLELHVNIHRVHSSHYGRYLLGVDNAYGQGQTEFLLQKGATEVDIEISEPPIVNMEPPVPQVTDRAAPEPTEKKAIDVTTQRAALNRKPDNVQNQLVKHKPREPLASTNAGVRDTRQLTSLMTVVTVITSIITQSKQFICS